MRKQEGGGKDRDRDRERDGENVCVCKGRTHTHRDFLGVLSSHSKPTDGAVLP